MNATAAQNTPRLLDRLPEVRGRYTENADLSKVTWFRVGGPAEVLFKPADADDLAHFLANTPADIPITVIGVASNLLIRDGGVPGVVIRLGGGFADITTEDTVVTAGAAALDANVAKTAANAGIGGLEFLSGIPGTIGGALRMNAGAYEGETKDILIAAEAVDRAGKRLTIPLEDMGYSYRHSKVPTDVIFTGARFQGRWGDQDAIRARMADIQNSRSTTQPIRSRTGGSTFKNPPGNKSWQLIDAAGGRGLRVGGAQMSEQHCNFMINTGDATAADLETLGEEIRARVKANSGIELDWEIKRIGVTTS